MRLRATVQEVTSRAFAGGREFTSLTRRAGLCHFLLVATELISDPTVRIRTCRAIARCSLVAPQRGRLSHSSYIAIFPGAIARFFVVVAGIAPISHDLLRLLYLYKDKNREPLVVRISGRNLQR